MTDWQFPQKPVDLAEKQLLEAILDGSFPVGSSLPAERELAQQLGITRPTLRETLQRLSRDGWITIHQGKPTLVNDYWREGNLIMLNALAGHPSQQNSDFIQDLLEVRCLLAPVYTELAVKNAADDLAAYLTPLTQLPDTAEAYAAADPDLHHQLTVLSGNPVYTLIYNGFRELAYKSSLIYFQQKEARDYSSDFYQGLLLDARKKDFASARAQTERVMRASIDFWNQSSHLPG